MSVKQELLITVDYLLIAGAADYSSRTVYLMLEYIIL